MSTLEGSIEQIYTAFRGVSRPLQITACPCCLSQPEVDVLLKSPLRELTPNALSAYSAVAFLTVGDVADYLYFLPRILEIAALEESWWPDPPIIGRGIRAAGVESWSRTRFEALVRYLREVVAEAIEAGRYSKIDDWLCAVARMELDVQPFLAQIAASPHAVLAYFEDNVRTLPEKRLSNAFWELPCAGHDAIVDWFFSESIRRVPFEAYGYIL